MSSILTSKSWKIILLHKLKLGEFDRSWINLFFVKFAYSERNFGVFKEPRGFIRVIQLFMTIFGFATTAGYSGSTHFQTTCPPLTTVTSHNLSFAYPFRISDTMKFSVPFCNATATVTNFLFYGNYTAPSQFYVFVGVMTMLYCLAILFFYIFMNDLYYQDDRAAKTDFIMSLIFAVLWFIASVAWADGVAKMKEYTSPVSLINQLKNRGEVSHYCLSENCTPGAGPNFAGLNISLIFGFTNCALWAAGLWFIWKETGWFERKSTGLTEPGMDESGGMGGSDIGAQY